MIVLRKTMEARLEAVNTLARADVLKITERYGKALQQVAALHQVMSAWIRNEPGDIKPEQMADMFYAQDDDWQAAFFNVMQDRVTAYHDAQPPSRTGYLSSPGYPAGEGQWYHVGKKLDDSGFQTLEAMYEHAKAHREPSE